MKKVLLSILTGITMLTAMAQDNNQSVKQRTVNVTGVAEMEVVPDEIYVQVSLKEYDKKGAGKIDLESIKNKFLEACKSIGLTEEDVSVQSYSGYDNWWLRKKKKQNPDLKAGITYSIKLASTKKMDELVDKMDDEATESFSIAKVSHSKINQYKKELKIKAVQAAKEKAGYLAEAIGEHVGEAVTINDANEITNDFPRPVMYANAMMKQGYAEDSASPMNVDFKKIKLQFEVNVVFALK